MTYRGFFFILALSQKCDNMSKGLKPRVIRWIASAKNDLSAMPDDVKDEVGQSLSEVQIGETPANSKKMRGKLSDVREIVVDDNGNTYRAIYTTRIGDFLYVLDAFNKKSARGRSTSLKDLCSHKPAIKECKGAPCEEPVIP